MLLMWALLGPTVKRKNQAYAMARHYSTEHPEWDSESDNLPFTSKLLKGPNIQGNLQRYLGEALLIRDFTDRGKKLLNGHGEWGEHPSKDWQLQKTRGAHYGFR